MILQEEIQDKDSNISKLQNENDQLNQDNQKLQEEIPDKDSNISKLKKEIDQLNQNNEKISFGFMQHIKIKLNCVKYTTKIS